MARVAMNNLRNLPVKTVAASEGIITRVSDSVSPMGGVNEGAAYYASPIAKGDLVALAGNADISIGVVKKYASGAAIGIAVSSPQGMDNVTVSLAAPIVSLMRRIDVAFFGDALIEIAVSVAQVAGQRFLGPATASSSTLVEGGMVVVRAAAVGAKAVVLVGHSGVLTA